MPQPSPLRLPGFSNAPETHFQEFWRSYPRKLGRAKALKIYLARLRDEPGIHAAILASLDQWRQLWQMRGTEIEYIPWAQTWLNQRRWEDDLSSEIQPTLAPRMSQTAVNVMGWASEYGPAPTPALRQSDDEAPRLLGRGHPRQGEAGHILDGTPQLRLVRARRQRPDDPPFPF